MHNDDKYNDFLNECKKVDFSKHSKNKEKNLKLLCEQINKNQEEFKGGNITMNKKTSKKLITAASLAAILILTSSTVYATGLNKVIKTFVLGEHSTHIQEEAVDKIPVPSELKGKLFDKNGKQISEINRDTPMYNSDGVQVDIKTKENGEYSLITEEEALAENKALDANAITFSNLKEGSSHFITDIANPTYLPKGYSFEKVQFDSNSKDDIKENGVGSKYMDIHYSNGAKSFISMIRYMDEETAYISGSDKEIKEITLNGHKAVVGEKSVTILIDKVEYAFFTNNSVSIDELIKVAESLK